MLPQYDEIVAWLPLLLSGLNISAQVAFLSLLFGIPLGLILAIAVQSRNHLVRALSLFCVEVGRGAPALVLLQFIYFGLPSAGISFGSYTAAIVALAWNTGAYTSEIIRASMQSVHHGQTEAAEALGLSRVDELRFVIVPQALSVALPTLLSFSILVFQGTSLCFAIALPELVSRAYGIGATTFRYFPALVCAGALYAAISIPAALLVEHLERRAGAYAIR